MPIYIILFLLLIRRLDVIPYRVDYTPAANAPARYSIFGPPTLGWVPEITAQAMCAEMVEEDHKAARRNAVLQELGLELPVSVES